MNPLFFGLSASALFLILMLIGALCYAGWQRDVRLHEEAEQEADREAAWREAQAEADLDRAEELASVGIYDWRHSGL